ncbi:MAG TPA: hypothetical protein DDW52_01580 [Planctomycetaceae bacterium]|nr:hypothetical protein [Planctomycetaceae bacterium]
MASIIKRDTLEQEPQAPAAFNFQDVRERADAVLAEAHSKAEAILAAAEEQAAAIRETAKAEGIAAAQSEFEQHVETEATKLSDARCKSAIQTCEQTVARLSSNTTDWLTQWRHSTVTLATQMAEKLVRRQMAEGHGVLNVWLEEAITATRDARDMRVLVNPDDFAVAGRFLSQLAKTVPQVATAEVVPDPEIQSGGCVVRTSEGLIDQQLEVQLERLVQQLG